MSKGIGVIMKKKYEALVSHLDERSLRLCLAADAYAIGYGGVSCVARATGISRTTIHAGMKELEEESVPFEKDSAAAQRKIRKPGGGRKLYKEKDDTLLQDLDCLLDPVTRGDPMTPLRWTCKSTTKLSKELNSQGHHVSQATVWRLLDELGYSMQSNRKVRDGGSHPDRNAQFEFISSTVKDFIDRGIPVISVDTKKKELVGEFKNAGREWQKKGNPVEVKIHDFADKELGKVIPYGVYDIGRNEGWAVLALRMTRQNLLWRPYGVGGTIWGGMFTRKRRNSSLLRTAGAAMDSGSNYGSLSFLVLPMIWGSKFMCDISHQARANGIRLNTGCFVISRRTGEVSHCEAV